MGNSAKARAYWLRASRFHLFALRVLLLSVFVCLLASGWRLGRPGFCIVLLFLYIFSAYSLFTSYCVDTPVAVYSEGGPDINSGRREVLYV